jgi:anti-anti-sigma regulatory factor
MGASPPTTIVVDVSTLAPDVVTVDALARLQLVSQRLGGRVQLRGVSDELQQLIAFAGLEGVLRVEPRREAEEREQRLGVEEEGELDDPPA